jgi:hypothetical protein
VLAGAAVTAVLGLNVWLAACNGVLPSVTGGDADGEGDQSGASPAIFAGTPNELAGPGAS